MKKLDRLKKVLLTLNLQDAAIKVAALERLYPPDEEAYGSKLSRIVERSIDALAAEIGVYSPTYLGHSDRSDVGDVGSFAFSVALEDGTPAVLKLIPTGELAPYKKLKELAAMKSSDLLPIIYDVKSFSELNNFKSELTADYEGYVVMEELEPLHEDISELFKRHWISPTDQVGKEKLTTENLLTDIYEMLSLPQIDTKLKLLEVDVQKLADIILKRINNFIKTKDTSFFEMDLERDLERFFVNNVVKKEDSDDNIASAVSILSSSILNFFIYGRLHNTNKDRDTESKLYKWPIYSRNIKPMDKLHAFVQEAYNKFNIRPFDLHGANVMTRADGSLVISDVGHFKFPKKDSDTPIGKPETEPLDDTAPIQKNLDDTATIVPQEYFRNS